jgi:hypothetical protein
MGGEIGTDEKLHPNLTPLDEEKGQQEGPPGSGERGSGSERSEAESSADDQTGS